VRELSAALRRHQVEGVIASNTTSARPGVAGLPHAEESGGLSGRPLAPLASTVLAALSEALAGEIPIIAVGGIMSGEDARARLLAGASLVQLYTGLVYRGPSLVAEVAEALATTASVP
jgi:dihydroorotate dehydrogenase